MMYRSTTSGQEPWRTEPATSLFEAILRLESIEEVAAFFRDLCTLGELHDMAQRWAVVRLLDAGLHYGEISTLTGASTATITRIAQWLYHGQGGYRLVLERTRGAAATRSPAGPTRPAAGPAATSPTRPVGTASTSVARPTRAAPSPADGTDPASQ